MIFKVTDARNPKQVSYRKLCMSCKIFLGYCSFILCSWLSGQKVFLSLVFTHMERLLLLDLGLVYLTDCVLELGTDCLQVDLTKGIKKERSSSIQ